MNLGLTLSLVRFDHFQKHCSWVPLNFYTYAVGCFLSLYHQALVDDVHLGDIVQGCMKMLHTKIGQLCLH